MLHLLNDGRQKCPAVEQLLLRIERAAHPFAALGIGVSQLQAATCAEARHGVAHHGGVLGPLGMV